TSSYAACARMSMNPWISHFSQGPLAIDKVAYLENIYPVMSFRLHCARFCLSSQERMLLLKMKGLHLLCGGCRARQVLMIF
ncbi:hypothetical protein P692DRAFT_20736802, partial [Suillus brevipes Sb2]